MEPSQQPCLLTSIRILAKTLELAQQFKALLQLSYKLMERANKLWIQSTSHLWISSSKLVSFNNKSITIKERVRKLQSAMNDLNSRNSPTKRLSTKWHQRCKSLMNVIVIWDPNTNWKFRRKTWKSVILRASCKGSFYQAPLTLRAWRLIIRRKFSTSQVHSRLSIWFSNLTMAMLQATGSSHLCNRIWQWSDPRKR